MVGNYTQRQGKKRMAEKKEAKLTDEGNRTQVSKIKRDHLTTTLHSFMKIPDYMLYIQSVWCFNSDKKEAWGVARFELRSR